jgi:outer membrane receptor protein involved in Fe transport
VTSGAEYRRFRNNNFNGDTGGFILFPSLSAFLAGTPSQSVETALPVTPALRVNAIGAFVQDDVKLTARLTLNLGLRWEYNGVPSEIHDRWDGPWRIRWSSGGPAEGYPRVPQ